MKKKVRSFNRIKKSAIKINETMSKNAGERSRGACRDLFDMLSESVEQCMLFLTDGFIRIARKPKRNKIVKRKYL